MAERGLEAITVSEVAHRAGLNRTTAYQHFRTRDDLVGALLEELSDEVTRMLVEPKPLGERIDHMAAFLVDHPEIARMTLHELLSDNPLPRAGWERYVGEVRRPTAGRKARAGVDAEMLAYLFACVGMLWPLLARVECEEAAGHGALHARGQAPPPPPCAETRGLAGPRAAHPAPGGGAVIGRRRAPSHSQPEGGET